MGLFMVHAAVVCILSFVAAKATASEVRVAIDPGERIGLSDWVAQKQLDVTPSRASVRNYE